MSTWRETFIHEPNEQWLLGFTPPVWRENQPDGLWLFKDTGTSDWFIQNTLSRKIMVRLGAGTPIEATYSWRKFEGSGYWKIGGRWLWRPDGSGFRITSTLGAGHEEYFRFIAVVENTEIDNRWEVWEALDESRERILDGYLTWFSTQQEALDYRTENEEYKGDAWWGPTSWLYDEEYKPRGSLRGDTLGAYDEEQDSYFVWWEIDGYRRDPGQGWWNEPAGVYHKYHRYRDENFEEQEDIDTNDTLIVGLGKWEDQQNTEYIESLEAEGANKTYGSIHHDGTGWVIGTRGSDAGWYEGGEPDIDSPVTFTRQKTEEGEYPGEVDLTVTYVEHIIGSNRETVHVAQMGMWVEGPSE